MTEMITPPATLEEGLAGMAQIDIQHMRVGWHRAMWVRSQVYLPGEEPNGRRSLDEWVQLNLAHLKEGATSRLCETWDLAVAQGLTLPAVVGGDPVPLPDANYEYFFDIAGGKVPFEMMVPPSIAATIAPKRRAKAPLSTDAPVAVLRRKTVKAVAATSSTALNRVNSVRMTYDAVTNPEDRELLRGAAVNFERASTGIDDLLSREPEIVEQVG